MTRIGGVFTNLKKRKEKALTLFLTSGYPHRESARSLVPLLASAGADIVEIGMPFSDPLADGPAIQESSTVSIRNGTTLQSVLEDVVVIRSQCQVPLVLMGYLNPILRYGFQKFMVDAASVGVDGIILPEVPLEECGRFSEAMKSNNLDHILLVTPTTPAERIKVIDRTSSGFVYCVSMTGVTGSLGTVGNDYLRSVRSLVSCNPLQIGFGISTPDDAKRLGESSDGVIIGSALIRKLKQGDSLSEIAAWVRSLKDVLRD